MDDLGDLYVVAAPSGTGKTSLVKALVASLPNIVVSISHTTRPRRPNEMHGVNYYFISKKEFLSSIAQEAFLEHAVVFGHYYGTSRQWVDEMLAKGIDVVLEIDWQGHQQVKHVFPHAIGIFVLPPSVTALHERLCKRNQDHPEVIKERLQDVKQAVSHLPEFTYVVVNDEFDRALADLQTIILAGRLQKRRQALKLSQLIKALGEPGQGQHESPN